MTTRVDINNTKTSEDINKTTTSMDSVPWTLDTIHIKPVPGVWTYHGTCVAILFMQAIQQRVNNYAGLRLAL
jgi:hypothetical protein